MTKIGRWIENVCSWVCHKSWRFLKMIAHHYHVIWPSHIHMESSINWVSSVRLQRSKFRLSSFRNTSSWIKALLQQKVFPYVVFHKDPDEKYPLQGRDGYFILLNVFSPVQSCFNWPCWDVLQASGGHVVFYPVESSFLVWGLAWESIPVTTYFRLSA